MHEENIWESLLKISHASNICPERNRKREGLLLLCCFSLVWSRFGPSARVYLVAPCMFGTVSIYSYRTDVLPPWWPCVGEKQNKEKKSKKSQLVSHRWIKGSWPFNHISPWSKASFHFSQGFAQCSILDWAALAILRWNLSILERGQGQHLTVTAIVLSWLAGGRFPRGCFTWQKTHLIYRNETLFFPPQVESWNSEHRDRVLGKSPNISNQT